MSTAATTAGPGPARFSERSLNSSPIGSPHEARELGIETVYIDRVDGVKQGLKKAHAQTKIVKEVTGQFDPEQAVRAMEDLLQTNPDVDAVFAANDQMALGAIQAIVEEVRGRLGGTGQRARWLRPRRRAPAGGRSRTCPRP